MIVLFFILPLQNPTTGADQAILRSELSLISSFVSKYVKNFKIPETSIQKDSVNLGEFRKKLAEADVQVILAFISYRGFQDIQNPSVLKFLVLSEEQLRLIKPLREEYLVDLEKLVHTKTNLQEIAAVMRELSDKQLEKLLSRLDERQKQKMRDLSSSSKSLSLTRHITETIMNNEIQKYERTIILKLSPLNPEFVAIQIPIIQRELDLSGKQSDYLNSELKSSLKVINQLQIDYANAMTTKFDKSAFKLFHESAKKTADDSLKNIYAMLDQSQVKRLDELTCQITGTVYMMMKHQISSSNFTKSINTIYQEQKESPPPPDSPKEEKYKGAIFLYKFDQAIIQEAMNDNQRERVMKLQGIKLPFSDLIECIFRKQVIDGSVDENGKGLNRAYKVIK